MRHPFPRRLERLVEAAIAHSRVTTVIGARQVGKTSLIRGFETASRPFVTLDDLDSLTHARSDPKGFIAGIGERIILDEIQRAPNILLAIKEAVDRDRRMGRFLLTGSANILTLPTISESLAGRMTILELYPLAEAEIERTDGNVVDRLFQPELPWRAAACTVSDVVRRIVRGGYPEAVLSADAHARDRWFASYLLAMIRRDMREIANVADVAAVSRLLGVVSARTGRIANLTALSSEAGIPKTTLTRHLALLEQTFLIHRMPAWSYDLGRRLTKSPKIFVADTGIAAHQMRVDVERLLADRTTLGGLVETFAANELRKHASWSDRSTTIYHYREQDGLEVDFLIEAAGGTRAAVEVKAGANPTSVDARNLLRLMDDPKLGLTRGIILHTGDRIVPIRENVHAVPISVFWTNLGEEGVSEASTA